ncbi:MAG: hypothetical protein LBP87_02345 [Planctomycetaceae bacterium]|jgi:hypothetical protein|nr:hypothetical protein [Planctomycetaceae bacterium]
MTQQFGNSLEMQGNNDRFPSEFCLTAVPAPVVHPVPKKLKRKRGRPRKALPLDILSPEFSCQAISRQTDWQSDQSVAKNNPIIAKPVVNVSTTSNHPVDCNRKKKITEKNLFHDDYFVSDSIDSVPIEEGLPFADEELATLDKFEKLSRSVERHSDFSYDIKRIDQPASSPSPADLPQRKKNIRRRQIDPSTCERDYSQDEVEFMNALNEYKRTSGRMFPTCSEILEVLKNLGYAKHNSNSEYNWNNNIPQQNTNCVQLNNL